MNKTLTIDSLCVKIRLHNENGCLPSVQNYPPAGNLIVIGLCYLLL